MKEWKNWRIKRKKGGEKDNEKDETEREHKEEIQRIVEGGK